MKLLRDGKDESAYIKIGTVVQNEVFTEALDVLQMYCDLVAGRVRLLDEPGHICPPELEEAISTLIFATPRIDVKELHQLIPEFQMKFGEEFVAKAKHNSSGKANAQVAYKLTTVTPDPLVCIKTLTEMAEKGGLDWDSSEMEKAHLTPHVDESRAPIPSPYECAAPPFGPYDGRPMPEAQYQPPPPSQPQPYPSQPGGPPPPGYSPQPGPPPPPSGVYSMPPPAAPTMGPSSEAPEYDELAARFASLRRG
jgi:vacuolar protein sorting-associated protein IST1